VHPCLLAASRRAAQFAQAAPADRLRRLLQGSVLASRVVVVAQADPSAPIAQTDDPMPTVGAQFGQLDRAASPESRVFPLRIVVGVVAFARCCHVGP